MQLKRTKGQSALPSKKKDPGSHRGKKSFKVESLVNNAPLAKGEMGQEDSARLETADTSDSFPTETLEKSGGPAQSDEVSEPTDQQDSEPITDNIKSSGSIENSDRSTAAVKMLQHENSELLERLQRAQADFENIRKRLIKEKSDVLQYAAMGTIESLLPIVDDFARALETPGIDPQLHQGLEMIGKRISEVFERAGLKEVSIEDTKFDPHLHHAVEKAPAENDEQDQKILEVFQKGYLFKDRLLRATLVKVAVKD